MCRIPCTPYDPPDRRLVRVRVRAQGSNRTYTTRAYQRHMRDVCRFAHTPDTKPGHAHAVCADGATAYVVPLTRRVSLCAHDDDHVREMCANAHMGVTPRRPPGRARSRRSAPGSGRRDNGARCHPKPLTGEHFRDKSSGQGSDEPTRRERAVPAGRRGVFSYLRETVRPFPPARGGDVRPGKRGGAGGAWIGGQCRSSCRTSRRPPGRPSTPFPVSETCPEERRATGLPSSREDAERKT